jgi:hypothetical protein
VSGKNGAEIEPTSEGCPFTGTSLSPGEELHFVRIAIAHVADEFRGLILVTVDKSSTDRTPSATLGRVGVADDMRGFSLVTVDKSPRTDFTRSARCIYKSTCAGGVCMKRLCAMRRCHPRQHEQTQQE